MKEINYKYIVTDNKVIALSTYAGRTVRGIAKCHPNDTFDVEFGMKLAAARCNMKIARLRFKRACDKVNIEADIFEEAALRYNMACEYVNDAWRRLEDAGEQLNDLQGV